MFLNNQRSLKLLPLGRWSTIYPYPSWQTVQRIHTDSFQYRFETHQDAADEYRRSVLNHLVLLQWIRHQRPVVVNADTHDVIATIGADSPLRETLNQMLRILEKDKNLQSLIQEAKSETGSGRYTLEKLFSQIGTPHFKAEPSNI
jgi:hypothetical protein